MPPQLDTRLPARIPADDEPQSVIHAPSGFKSFEESKAIQQSPTERSDHTVVSPRTPDALRGPDDKVWHVARLDDIVLTIRTEIVVRLAREHRCSAIQRSLYATGAYETRFR